LIYATINTATIVMPQMRVKRLEESAREKAA
jgi:hypothetical protein